MKDGRERHVSRHCTRIRMATSSSEACKSLKENTGWQMLDEKYRGAAKRGYEARIGNEEIES